MNKLGLWGLSIALAFLAGSIVTGTVVFADEAITKLQKQCAKEPKNPQKLKPECELLALFFGLQTQVDDLEERVTALENPPPPPPPPEPPIEIKFFIDDLQVLSFSGAQVVHLVLFDPDIADTDETETEPVVGIKGGTLRMVQGTDGRWHAYFAHRANALIADSGVAVPGTGFDFGVFCSSASGVVLGPTIDVTATEGFAIQDPALVTNEINGNPDGAPLTNLCSNPNPTETPNDIMAVLNGVVDITQNFPSAELDGQIGIRKGFWPFIQLFSFTAGEPSSLSYSKAGGAIVVPFGFLGPSEGFDVSIVAGSNVPGCQDTNQCFIPFSVSINVGDTILWSNDDTAAHTVTSGDPADAASLGALFDSSLILPGDTFSVNFAGFAPDQYDYFCLVHPWMTGEVIVT